MPRRNRGLGAVGSRVPVKGLTGLLKNLDPGIRNQLDSAFSGAEDILNAHVLSVPENQTKRLSTGLINQVQATVENTLLGAFISWPRLDDPRISMYEIQTSDSNIFSSFETFQILEQFFVLENVITTKFIRIRGVRADGQTGLWSDTLTISPIVTTPVVHSLEFYQSYNGAEPTLNRKLRYSKGSWNDNPTFYTILSHNFYTNALAGATTFWGFVSNRLKNHSNQSVQPWDRIRFSVNGITNMEGYFPHWVNRFDEKVWNINDFYANKDNVKVNSVPGAEMSFYGKGGYTASFGPYAIQIPNLIAGEGPNDPNTVLVVNPVGGSDFYWEDPDNSRLPSNFEEGQLRNYAELISKHETHCDNISPGQDSNWIVFKDFKFKVPDNKQITGIKAEVKRRQYPPSDLISSNLGIRRPDKLSGFDCVLDYISSPSLVNVSPRDIYTDSSFGRYLDLTAGINVTDVTTQNLALTSGRLSSDRSGIGTDSTFTLDDNVGIVDSSAVKLITSKSFSVSGWIYIPSSKIVVNGLVANHILFWAAYKNKNSTNGEEDDQTNFINTANNIRLQISTNRASGIPRIIQAQAVVDYQVLDSLGQPTIARAAKTRTFTIPFPSGAASTDTWHHLAMTYNETSNDLILWYDGVSSGTLSTTGGFTAAGFPQHTRTFGIGTLPGTSGVGVNGSCIGYMAQVGIWNSTLSQNEILAIYNQRGTADYRYRFGRYKSNSQLNHYFLAFPDQADIRDDSVVIVDSSGTIREDLDNKALLEESWPRLGQFFYTDVRQFGILPLAYSDGIPHDNHLAIGYQSYGGLGDTWGASLTSSDVNNSNFGFALKIKNQSTSEFNGTGLIDHARMTVYYPPDDTLETKLKVEVAASNLFYIEREVFGGLFNMLEIGE